MRNSHGYSLAETLIALAVGAMLLVMVIYFAVPKLAREAMRSSIYDVQGFMRLARTEAVSRNRACRFVLSTADPSLSILDGMGTVATGDDEVLHTTHLPAVVSFARPDAGVPVTLAALNATTYGVTFSTDGSADVGGDVILFGGGRYRRVTLSLAGGQQVTRWDGSAWSAQ